jgi:hypothetical protein
MRYYMVRHAGTGRIISIHTHSHAAHAFVFAANLPQEIWILDVDDVTGAVQEERLFLEVGTGRT